MFNILLLAATAIIAIQPNVYLTDQYGRIYKLKEHAFENPFESPLVLVEGEKIKLEKTKKQKIDQRRIEEGLLRCKNAACRIVKNTIVYRGKQLRKIVHSGTGVAIREDNHFIYVITAGHVVGTKKSIDVYFSRNDKISEAIKAQVLWNRFNVEFTEQDLCMLRIAKKDFGHFPLPDVIPLAKENTKIARKEPIISVGYPRGFTPSNWTGVTVAHLDDLIPFVPGPSKGQSGAAICDVDGKHVLGIIVRRYETIGVAISGDKIWEIERKILGKQVIEERY